MSATERGWLSVEELIAQEHELRWERFDEGDAWLLRKARVARRFHNSSLHVGQLCRDAGRPLEQVFHVSRTEYAGHGGAFPLAVEGVGVIGSVAVSGLPQLEDHALVVDVLRAVLSH